jgi:hypothetical protein
MALPYFEDVGFDREEVLQWYRNNKALASKQAAPSRQVDLRSRPWALDPIDPMLIGCAKRGMIVSTRERLGKWGRPLEAWAGHTTPRHREAAQSVFVQQEGTFSKMFGPELISIGLLSKHEKQHVHAPCGLFGVPKKELFLRVIFDARPANALLEPLDTALVLFTVDELARVWASAGEKGDVFIINVDYRHYYYQLKIPKWLIPYVVVRINGVDYHPSALPMGYRDACVIAQVITWCIVLHREADEDPLGVPEQVVLGDVMPPYLPLEGGGAIFVLLDGVFIMDPNQERHKRWKQRLERNETHFGIRRKVGHAFALTEAGISACTCQVTAPDLETDPDDTALAPPVEGTCDEDDAATFAGIRFLSRHALRPARQLKHHDPKAAVTWRIIAGRLGSVMWHLRVLGAGRLTTGNEHSLLHQERILRLWTEVGQKATEEHRGWDERTSVNLDQLVELEESLAGTENTRDRVAKPICRACIQAARIFAVDATPTKIGYVECRFIEGRLEIVDWVGISIPETDQGAAELQAALEVADKVQKEAPGERCRGCQNPPLVIIGGDADGARAALRKGYSCSVVFRALMRPVYTGGRVRVETVRIPGVYNVADGASRDRPPTAEEWDHSRRILQEAVLFLYLQSGPEHEGPEEGSKNKGEEE